MSTADEIRHYETRLARDGSAQAHAALAEAYRRAGRLDEAVVLCRRGLERHPAYPTTRFVLAKALVDRGEVGAARTEIERFLQSEPEHEPALRLAAECALRGADPRAALDHLVRLQALDPEDRAIQGQVRALEVAVTRRVPPGAGGLWPLLSDDTYTTVTFGNLCADQGLLDEATAVFCRIVLREPGHDGARARLMDLGRGRVQARRRA